MLRKFNDINLSHLGFDTIHSEFIYYLYLYNLKYAECASKSYVENKKVLMAFGGLQSKINVLETVS